MDFLLVLTKLFSLGVTAESLRAKIEVENRRFRSNAVTLIQNFRYKGSPPPIIFARLVGQWMPYNFAADNFCHGWVTWGWGKFRDSRGRDRCVEVDRTAAAEVTWGEDSKDVGVGRWKNTEIYTTIDLCLIKKCTPWSRSGSDNFHTQKNFVADFLQAKCDFLRKLAVLRFWDPLLGT